MKIIIVALQDIDLPHQAFHLSDEQVYYNQIKCGHKSFSSCDWSRNWCSHSRMFFFFGGGANCPAQIDGWGCLFWLGRGISWSRHHPANHPHRPGSHQWTLCHILGLQRKSWLYRKEEEETCWLSITMLSRYQHNDFCPLSLPALNLILEAWKIDHKKGAKIVLRQLFYFGQNYAEWPAPQENALPRTSLVQRHKPCESIR